MQKALDLRNFAILLITTLANNSEVNNPTNKDNKIAFLPVDYKQRIENILCAENAWKEKFSSLIDIQEYFDDHFMWEHQLALQIKNILQQMDKNFEYDFLKESINISFTQKEIDLILSKYKDESIKNTMNYFVSLISDYIYTREYQERFNDYNSRSVQYIKKYK